MLEADPGFGELLARGWPGWGGPMLPSDVVAALSSGKPARLARRDLILRSDAADGVLLVHVRRAVAADRLTSREREIAEGFSLGETHRELGERLGVSPNTVRRHLSNIYQKLGISSKVELDRMLSSAR